MKLDFSALAQPAAKARGQVGTTGTPASTRVCASPHAHPGVGTTGDKLAAALVADLVVAVPAACPPVSPACPQVRDAAKLNAGAVSPASPLVPVKATHSVATAPFKRKDAADRPTGAAINTSADPPAAGLLTAKEGFGVVWPQEGHGEACPAIIGKMPSAASDRPHRLTKDEADRCHTACRDDAEIAAFTARTERFALLGRADADDLAETLTLRDRDGDDRRLCLECTWLGDTGRCLAAATGRIRGADRRLEPVPTVLQRCGAFGLRKGLA